MAGELIRLLINHPDIEIKWVNSARYAGRLVSDIHHGLIGETDLRISPTADLSKIDALFIFRHKGQTVEWLAERVIPTDLRIIDLSVDMQIPENAEEYDFVYGLPELNRKTLVRGAKRAIVPHPMAALSALAILPVAKAEKLNGDIHTAVTAPKLGEAPEVTNEDIINEIRLAIRELQPVFNKEITLDVKEAKYDRAIEAIVTLPVTSDIGEITRRYEEFYDDHNFVFIVNTKPEAKEVEGTNKCLIYLDKRDGRLEVHAMMDALLKGAAGTAVHDMNLLFGLLELTGLTLKASTF